jgi:hypothetical protein
MCLTCIICVTCLCVCRFVLDFAYVFAYLSVCFIMMNNMLDNLLHLIWIICIWICFDNSNLVIVNDLILMVVINSVRLPYHVSQFIQTQSAVGMFLVVLGGGRLRLKGEVWRDPCDPRIPGRIPFWRAYYVNLHLDVSLSCGGCLYHHVTCWHSICSSDWSACIFWVCRGFWTFSSTGVYKLAHSFVCVHVAVVRVCREVRGNFSVCVMRVVWVGTSECV